MIYEGKQKIWSDYQKEIPDDHYFYVRSCIRQTFFPASEATFLRITRQELGKDIFETEHHTTCGGIAYHSDTIPQETMMTIIARQFALMTKNGYENYVCSCITSFGLYCETMETWREYPELEAKVRENLWKSCKLEFNKPKFLVHASDLIYKYRNLIAAQAKHKLVNIHTGRPLRVVEHIGCHYSKMFPSKGVGGAEYPYVLVGMVEAWGGEIVDYPERRHCCGFGFRQYLIKGNRSYSLSNTHKKFESMEPFHPDMIITNCPGCPYFLDRWQYVIAKSTGKTYGEEGHGIPVFTYEEVAGLVLGYDPWDLGLQTHQVSVEPLLDKMGVEYDPARKFLGNNGKDIGRPGWRTFLPDFLPLFCLDQSRACYVKGIVLLFPDGLLPALCAYRSRIGYIQKIQIHCAWNAPHHEAIAGRPGGSLQSLDDFPVEASGREFHGRPKRWKFPDCPRQPSVALDIRKQIVLHAGVVGIFNMFGSLFRRDAIQPLHAHPDGGSVDFAAQCRHPAPSSSQRCR